MYAINMEQNKKELNIPDEIKIFDTTLRDGEQAPGIALTVDEKIKIAQRLDELGVNVIEMGFPTVSSGERKAAREMVSLGFSSELCGLARVVQKDIDALIDSDLSYAHLFIGTSPLHRDYKLKKSKTEILSQSMEMVEYAKDHGLKVEFSAEDATRTELNYLIEFYKGVESAGADIINVPDTVGILVPSTTRTLIRTLRKKINLPISLHFHNDFGLAVSNSLIGIEEGANQAHCTINGIGERAGNTSLEELVVSLKIAYGANLTVDTTKLYDTSNFIGSITGIKMPPTKPIVGDNAFAHESGIHVDGILKNSSTYEPIAPEIVGHKRRIALGKHTGHAAIKSKLEEFNIEVTQKQFDNIYNQVKTLGDKGKCLTDDDLRSIAITEIGTSGKEYIKLLGLSVMTGESVSATATIKLSIDGKIMETSQIGVGPVDASVLALKTLVQDRVNISLDEYRLEAITGGTDALAETFVVISDDKGNKATGRATREDVILSSVIAVINSINRILDIQENC
ncbi:2-isopropylmalate synthase LeuA [Methanobrevibacter ruminantium M1]|uniref:2-isopropylmalate synthase LeuA n=1 Tax=Methanobrevibacter ruminantium (strain ATCC 35063 / DSM 1093 / JCM 13430 / OCM 146 / M1) TaxID=634498 RepID=D3E1C0_METRM|nr:2-isopropylmalate synthase LeuA [Methanobrevibacter ruminantium M1]